MVRRLFASGVLLGALAFGQRGGGMGEEGGMGGRGGVAAPTIPMRKSRMELLSDVLKLNKDQKKQVKAALDDGQKEADPIREQITRGRAQIAEAIAAGKSQAEIDQAVKAYAALEGQMAAIELKAFSKIYLSLDEEQKSKTPPVFQMMSGIFMNKNWNET